MKTLELHIKLVGLKYYKYTNKMAAKHGVHFINVDSKFAEIAHRTIK